MAGTGSDIAGSAGRRQRLVAAAAFACVMGLALFVRLYRIGEEGLHGDELTILKGLYEQTFAGALQATRRLDPPMTPVSFLIQYAWVRAVGLTVLRMHLLSVFFSAATFVAVFFIGRRLKGTMTGLAAMLLLAVSPMHVYYSLEIRNYSLTALLGTLSLLTLLRAVERPNWRIWSVNFSVDVLLAMSHLFANLLFVPQVLFLLVCHRRRAVLLPWGAFHAVIAAVVALWLRSCDFAAIRSVSAYIGPLSREGAYAMLTGITGASYSYDCSGLIGRTGVMGAVIVALFPLGLCALLAEWLLPHKQLKEGNVPPTPPNASHGVFLLVLTVFVPPMLLMALTQSHTHCFFARYALCSAVAVPILLACAVTMPRSRAVRIVLAAALAFTTVSLLDQILRTRPQRSLRWPICQALHDGVKPADNLVLLPPYADSLTSDIEILLQASPKRILHKTSWSQSDYHDLSAWHAQGIQVWLVSRLEKSGNAEFECALNVLNLPFRKQTFKVAGFVLYCVPVDSGPFAAPDSAVTHAPLGAGSLRGWFTADRLDKGNGMGITHMVSREHPFAPVFTRPSLSLDRVMEDSPAKAWLPWDDPHAGPMQLSLCSPDCAEARWPLRTPENVMDCRMRYAFSEKNAVDMLFEVTPRAGQDCRGPLVFSLTSRVNGACSPAIHFPGVRNAVEGWVSFGESPSERGAVAGTGPPEREAEQADAAEGLRPVRGVRFSEPVYYGLVDGDQNDATTDDEMVFILMFEHPEDTRFVLRDSGDAVPSVAWDWQYVLRAPEPGKTYGQRVRMVYKPFLGEKDVLAEYRAWLDAPPSRSGSTGNAYVSLPVFPGPGEEECDPAALACSVAEVGLEKALDTYVALLEVPLCRRAAADGIDTCFIPLGDGPGLAAQWEAIAARDGQDALPWSRLGGACRRMGDSEKAAAAFLRGLDRDAQDPDCLLGLAALRFDQGRAGDAVKLAGAAVARHAELAVQAADLCVAAARVRLAAGDVSGAEAASREALRFAPGDASSKVFMGRLLANRGETENGLALIKEAVSGQPDIVEEAAGACTAAAKTRLKAGDIAGSAVALRCAAALVSATCQYAVTRAGILETVGDTTSAENAYRDALKQNPRLVPARINLGTLLAARGDTVGGHALISEAVSSTPSAMGRAAATCAALAKKRMQAGDPSGAVDAYRRALFFTTKVLGYRVDLAAALEAVGDNMAAITEYRTVAEAVPESPKSSARIDAILDGFGDGTARAAQWRRLVAVHPDAAVPQLHLGLALEASGDAAGARTALEKAIKINPALTGARDALGRLDNAADNGRQ